MNEAALRGIDLKTLETERPTSRQSTAQMRRHNQTAEAYWAWRRADIYLTARRADLEPPKRGKQYKFTDRQIEIALKAMEGNQ